jgi:proteasome lid subunit RPN8/RPN11
MATLRLAPGVEWSIRRHAAEAYPNECCGALIVRDQVVEEAFALPNTTDEGPRRRFLVAPSDYREAERRAASLGGELGGFYHSHPDHPAQPSEYDRAHAWPNLSYVIVSVAGGEQREMFSWRLRDDRAAFDPEAIDVEEAPEPTGSRSLRGVQHPGGRAARPSTNA